MTQNYELPYRKVCPVKRTYQNVAFYGNSGKLSIRDDSNTSTLRNEEYHNQIKPMLNMLRLLGILPLEMSSYGKFVLGALRYTHHC
jgi:hypothetical protein